MRQLIPDSGALIHSRTIALLGLLVVANLTAWTWALVAFGHDPALLGTAFLAYGFGLRHAVDADHIAAIDGVTRKLLDRSKRPLGIGLFFSLGHSTIVVAATAAIVFAAATYRRHLDQMEAVGAVAGTVISAAFLFIVAIANLRIFIAGRRGSNRSDPAGPNAGGALAWLLRPALALVGRSWQMYPVGLLFGLGFDTASEVGLLGISAMEMAKGLPVASIFVFPALFTAAMVLVDTADGILMLGVYGWALAEPVRKRRYNQTVTLVSALVAVAVGSAELLSLLDEQAIGASLSTVVEIAIAHSEELGLLTIAFFLCSWLVAQLIRRNRGVNSVDAVAAS